MSALLAPPLALHWTQDDYLLERADLYASTPLERALVAALDAMRDQITELTSRVETLESELEDTQNQLEDAEKQAAFDEKLIDRLLERFDEIDTILDPTGNDEEAHAVYADIFVITKDAQQEPRECTPPAKDR